MRQSLGSLATRITKLTGLRNARVRTRLLAAFGALMLLGALNIGVTEFTSRQRSSAFQELHHSVERQRILWNVAAVVEDQQQAVTMVAGLFAGEALTGAAELADAVREKGRQVHERLSAGIALTDDDRTVALTMLRASTDSLFRSWVMFFDQQPVDPSAAIREIAGTAEPLATELLDNTLPREIGREERTLDEARSAFVQSDATAARLVWMIFLTSGAFAAVIFVLITHELLASIHGLRQGAERLRGGALEHRIPVRGRDELGGVAESFNGMAASLQSARDEVELRNDQLADALQRLKDAQHELVQTEKLGALGGMLAGLAHELNNPLACVLGYAELIEVELARGNTSPAELGELLEPVLGEAKRARELIRNQLHFSRSSLPTVGPVDVAEAMKVAVTLRSYAFAQADLQLVVDAPSNLWAIAESQKLQQVFINIINNAFDALREHGGTTLRISTHSDSDSVEVLFEDDGPGIASPEKVFDPFYTTKPPGQGTGLGLTLVHRFQTEFGGSISVANRPEGGARFVLRFRAAKAPALVAAQPVSAAPPSPARPRAMRPVPAGPQPQSPVAPASHAPRRRVLVVEDEAPLRNLHARLLRALDVELLFANEGIIARDLLQVEQVDLVISDVKMPGQMNGAQLYRWVAEHKPELADRFLFVTGDVHDASLNDLRDQLAHRFIHKPFQRAEYMQHISEVLGELQPAVV